MQPETLRLALIGAGGIGQHHLKLLADPSTTRPGDPDAAPAAAKVVGLFDIDAEAARAAATKFHVPRVYPSLEAAVGDAGIDAVIVCSPNTQHEAAVVAALQAGKHCLCEKPLGASAAEIERMIAARDRSGKLLMTAQHMRFETSSVSLKRLIDAGRLGEVYYARAWWLRRRMVPTRPTFLSRKLAGRGPGLDIGVHVLDLTLHFLGFPRPVGVSGVTSDRLGRRPNAINLWGAFDAADFEVEDFAAAFIRFENGLALSLEVSWLLNNLEREQYGVWLYGTQAGAQWPELKLAQEQDGLLIDAQAASGTGADGHRNELIAFCEAVRARGPSPVPAEQSLVVARILDGLYESAERGKEVRL